MENIPLSVVVLAKNEQEHIQACLRSVAGWADEVLVFDDESDDQTVVLAEQLAERVIVCRMENEGRHRNRAYAQCRHDWVLSLDADEEVSPELKVEIERVLADHETRAYAIPIRTYIGSYWVRYSGWYPASKLRLFRRDFFRYEEAEVHPRAFVDGKTGTIAGDIIHRGYADVEHFLLSVNRQSSLEAKKWLRTGVGMTRGRIARRSVDRFFRSYLRKRGFKDGFLGFIIALFASLYQILSYAKYLELKNKSE